MLSRIPPLLFSGWRHFGASAKWTYKSPSEHLRRLSAPSETGKWTVKDRVTLKKLRKSGKTDEEIASLLGRSVASVKWELPRTHRDPWTEEELCKLDALIAQKVSNRVMADALGRSVYSVSNAKSRRSRTASQGKRAGRPYARPKTVHRKWTEDESMKLLEMRRGGASIVEAANALGRSRHSTAQRERRGASGEKHLVMSLDEQRKMVEMRDSGMPWKDVHFQMPRWSQAALCLRYHRIKRDSFEATRTGELWSQEDLDELRRLVAEGVPFRDIAVRMGRSPSGVRRAYRYHIIKERYNSDQSRL